ncbi:MAG: CopG family ribbon-helix-helix protein [Thaumarchaeota archaeon]|jgi:CopG family nickel-responsive transcriptional regulator|nr:CopG family ribbon-helix-helix protein [Nitrososphaerota archaeon]
MKSKKKDETFVRFSATVPPSLLEDFDKLVKSLKLDRSKGIQIAMRNFITEESWRSLEPGNYAGVVLITYNHETPGIEEKLTDLQHLFLSLIAANVHVHLTTEDCMEAIIVKGEGKKIKHLSESISSVRGIKQVKVSVMKMP